MTRTEGLYRCGSNRFDPEVLSGLLGDQTVECCLQRLDDNAWNILLEKASGKDFSYHTVRGLYNFFDIFNEARAYCFLADNGHANIQFIQENPNKNTPDLKSTKNGEDYCIEVKTVYCSIDDDGRVYWDTFSCDPEARDVSQTCSDGLKKKITDDLDKAFVQLAYCKAKGIVFFKISLDSTAIPAQDSIKTEIKSVITSEIESKNRDSSITPEITFHIEW